MLGFVDTFITSFQPSKIQLSLPYKLTISTPFILTTGSLFFIKLRILVITSKVHHKPILYFLSLSLTAHPLSFLLLSQKTRPCPRFVHFPHTFFQAFFYSAHYVWKACKNICNWPAKILFPLHFSPVPASYSKWPLNHSRQICTCGIKSLLKICLPWSKPTKKDDMWLSYFMCCLLSELIISIETAVEKY